jgi:hypothetical protein
MDGFFDLSWRSYPAAIMIVFGLITGVIGIYQATGRAMRTAPTRITLLPRIQGFRIAVIGFALAALGISWITQQLWLFVVALGVGGEEMLESSFYIWVLRRERRATLPS